MASRAIIIERKADALVSRLDSWRMLAVESLTRSWNDLAPNVGEPNPFNEIWFLKPALEQFDPEGRVQLFALWSNDVLLGLMPITPQASYGRWPV